MIVVYYGVNLSLSLPFCLSVSLPLFFFPSSSSAYAPIFIPLRCLSLSFCILNCPYSASFPFLVLCLCPNPHFHFLHRPSINLFQPLPLPSASSSGFATSQSCPLPCFSRFLYALCLCPNLHPPSLPLAIFLHLELSLSCLFSISRPSVNPSGTPSLSYLSFSSGLSISPGLLLLLLLLLRAILLCPRCSARCKYSLFAPPP